MDSFTATAQRSTEVADAVARHPERFRVLTGERPTGALHLGRSAYAFSCTLATKGVWLTSINFLRRSATP